MLKPDKTLDPCCGNCNHSSYPEGGDNGTVACGKNCTLRNKYDAPCKDWEWPRWIAKPELSHSRS
jgi:hypothetical protein